MAVLFVLTKIFDKMAHKFVFNHFKWYIFPVHYGFVVGKSVSKNLLSFTSYVTLGLYSRAKMDALFLDLTTGFYSISRSEL